MKISFGNFQKENKIKMEKYSL